MAHLGGDLRTRQTPIRPKEEEGKVGGEEERREGGGRGGEGGERMKGRGGGRRREEEEGREQVSSKQSSFSERELVLQQARLSIMEERARKVCTCMCVVCACMWRGEGAINCFL